MSTTSRTRRGTTGGRAAVSSGTSTFILVARRCPVAQIESIHNGEPGIDDVGPDECARLRLRGVEVMHAVDGAVVASLATVPVHPHPHPVVPSYWPYVLDRAHLHVLLC